MRRALAAAARIGVPRRSPRRRGGSSRSWSQARYGADVLAYSETRRAGVGHVAGVGGRARPRLLAVLRRRRDRPLEQRRPRRTSPAPALIALGLVLAAPRRRGRWSWSGGANGRGFAALLVLVGLVVSVGAHPYGDPSLVRPPARPASAREHHRPGPAVLAPAPLPLVLLGLALAVGAAVTALGRPPAGHGPVGGSRRRRRAGRRSTCPRCGTAPTSTPCLRRPSDVPAVLAPQVGRRPQRPPATAPASSSCPARSSPPTAGAPPTIAILPGLTTAPDADPRPAAARRRRHDGSCSTPSTTASRTGTVEPASIAPVARLLGAGAIVFRGDTAFERYRTAPPRADWALYQAERPGLGPPTSYGPPVPNRRRVADARRGARSAIPGIGQPVPPAAVVAGRRPVPIVRAATPATSPSSTAAATAGLVAAAAAGLLDDPGRYRLCRPRSPATPPRSAAATQPGAPLVVTDTNRKRAEQWRGSQDTTGFTEDAGDGVLRGRRRRQPPARLPRRRHRRRDAGRAAGRGDGAVASAYGEPNAYRPEDRADSGRSTATRPRRGGSGDRGEVHRPAPPLRAPPPARTSSQLTVVQPLDPAANRWITAVTVRTARGLDDGGAHRRVPDGRRAAHRPARRRRRVDELGRAGGGRHQRRPPVQLLRLGRRRLRRGRHRRPARRRGRRAAHATCSTRPAPASADHDLTFVLTRLRHDPHDRWRDDEERSMARELTVPTDRALHRDRDGAAVGPGHRRRARPGCWPTRRAPRRPRPRRRGHPSSRLAGTPTAWGRAAVDGDPATAWTSAFGTATGASLVGAARRARQPSTTSTSPSSNDGRHSVPTRLSITNEAGEQRLVDVPAPPAVAPGQAPAARDGDASLR